MGAGLAVVVVDFGLRAVVVVGLRLTVVLVVCVDAVVAAARLTTTNVVGLAAVVVVTSSVVVVASAVTRDAERLARCGTSRAANSRDDGEAFMRYAALRGRDS